MQRDLFLPNTPVGIAASLLTGRPVSDGESVNASVTNRLPQTNQINSRYIYELLKQLRNTSGEFLRNVPVAQDVVPGDFVYYDGVNRIFAKGLARYQVQDGTPRESESAAVWGVVVRVGHQEADLCTSGLCEFQTDMATYLAFPEPGVRYLSDNVAGEPTPDRHRPEKSLGYLVGVKSDATVQFFVRPLLVNDPHIHRHKRFELANVPAGSCEATEPKQIRSVRTDKPGWIPASDPIFSGSAPTQAVYGYNPEFLKAGCEWPLRFAANAGLRWQRRIAATDDPLLASVPPEFYLIDETTIWWLVDTPYLLPWDSTISYSGGEPVQKPDSTYGQRIWLEYVDSGYGLTDSPVSSLRAADGSGLKITQYPFGGPGVTGDLLLDFDLEFQVASKTDMSGTAVKKVDKNTLSLGPVVSGLKLDSKWFRVIDSEQTPSGFHFGQIVIGDPTGRIGSELPLEAVHLQGVEETVEREAIGLAFPAARESSFLARIVIPHDAGFGEFSVSLVFGILVTRSGNVSRDALKLEYRILEQPASSNTITQAFPQSSLQRVECDFSVQNNRYSQGYYTVESEKFRVGSGSLVFLKVQRTPPDNFNDRIILLRKSAILHLH